jgi:uncharacterized protein with HEPN domain
MRRRDPRASLAEALGAGENIKAWLDGVTLEQYLDDEILRSAVERQFEIVGEALSRALEENPSLAEPLPEARGVVGFRNRLAHGYDDISSRVVWSIALENLPPLLAKIRRVLKEIA